MTKNCLFALMLASMALWMGCARGLQSIPSVTVATNPANQSVVGVSLSVNLVATVTGASSTGVNWSLSGSSCTGSACGTITSAGSDTAVYTAPSTLPTGKNSLSVTITATSQADAAGQGQLTVSVLPITVSVAPTPVQVGQGLIQQFTAVAVPDNVPQKFTWTVSCTQAGACGTLTQRAPDCAQRIEHLGQGPIAGITVQQFRYAPTQQRQAPRGVRQRGGHQQRNVAHVVATDGDRDQALRAVQRGNLGWLAALLIGKHMSGGRAGKGDVNQFEVQ